MAQHDYNIANQSGAAFRADLNNALLAIVSQNSGTSAPSTTFAHQFWADTTTGTLKIRNAANSAWIELMQLDGTLTMEDGTALLPGLAFRDDLNTGLFSDAADTLGISTGGVERVEFGTTAVVFNDGGADVDFRVEGDTNANLFFVDAGNDRVGIGDSAPSEALTVSGKIQATTEFKSETGNDLRLNAGSVNRDIFMQVNGSTLMTVQGSTGNVGIGTDSPGTNPAVGNDATILEIRQTTAGSLTAGNTRKGAVLRLTHDAQWENPYGGGDDLGSVEFASTDTSTGEGVRARIRCTNNAYYHDQDLVFDVGVSTSATISERLRILNEGGITFNGDTSAANALDDYEEGSWTPTLSPASGSFGSVTYVVQSGTYTKIGRTVFLRANFYTNGITLGTASGNLRVSGLPFVGASLSGMALHDVRLWSKNPSTCGVSGSLVYLYKRSAYDGGDTPLEVSDLDTSGVANLCQFSGVYDI